MRQFILGNQKVKNGIIELGDKDFRYLRQVLRVKVGDMINVRMPDGVLENSTVAHIDDKGKKITLQLCASNTGAAVSYKSVTRGVQASQLNHIDNAEFWLFQFIPKPQKFEQIVRQATECGISTIVPVIGEYTEKSSVLALQGAKRERIEKIIREARQQSGSPVDTKVLAPMSLDEAVSLWGCGENNIGFVLSERDEGDNSVRSVIDKKKKENIDILKVGIAVGSEGGLSPKEIEKLQKSVLFNTVHFAVNILRCETAALYGIAAVQTAFYGKG